MNFKQTFPLLFASKWTATGLAPAMAAVNRRDLYAEYQSLVGRAPRRADSGKPYFVGHDGVPSSGRGSNRFEEHYAIALFNLDKQWPCAHGGQFRLLDYQFPLKARQGDAGIGKIDLLGVTDKGRLMVIELKVKPDSGRGEAPPAALMEGLRYAAIVQANLDAIANEANAHFGRSGVRVSNEPPMILLLAPQAWWRGWQALRHTVAGNWQSAFNALIQDVQNNIGVTIGCAELQGGKLAMGLNGQKPKLDPAPTLVWR